MPQAAPEKRWRKFAKLEERSKAILYGRHGFFSHTAGSIEDQRAFSGSAKSAGRVAHAGSRRISRLFWMTDSLFSLDSQHQSPRQPALNQDSSSTSFQKSFLGTACTEMKYECNHAGIEAP